MAHISSESDPFVTVVIIAYNYARFVSKAIDSVLTQSYPASRMEILVVDDGSTDDTPEVVGTYAERVCYIRKTNGGQGSAINGGFRRARGEIICLLDADDYYYADKVRLVVDVFRGHPEVGVVYHKFNVVDHHGGTLYENWPIVTWAGNLEGRTLLGYSWGFPTSTISVRKTVVEDFEVPEEEFRRSADTFLGSILPLVTQVGVIQTPLSTYFFHGNNSALLRAPSAATLASIQEQSCCIRCYAWTRLGKRFVTYLGRSRLGASAEGEAHGVSRVRAYLEEFREIAGADVDPAIKLLAQLKLALCLALPRQYYDQLKRLKAVLIARYINKKFSHVSKANDDFGLVVDVETQLAHALLHPSALYHLTKRPT